MKIDSSSTPENNNDMQQMITLDYYVTYNKTETPLNNGQEHGYIQGL